METKRRDKSKKRNEILAAAIRVFTGAGYELASMDRIAQVAGVSKRTVYNHFKNKETLFEAIVSDMLVQRRNLETIPYDAGRPLYDQLRAFAEAEIDLIETKQRLELSRFLTVTFLKDLKFQKLVYGKFPPLHAMLSDWLTAARDDGRIQTGDVTMAARMFYALVTGAVTWPAMFMERFDRRLADPALDEAIRMFLCRYESREKPAEETKSGVVGA